MLDNLYKRKKEAKSKQVKRTIFSASACIQGGVVFFCYLSHVMNDFLVMLNVAAVFMAIVYIHGKSRFILSSDDEM